MSKRRHAEVAVMERARQVCVSSGIARVMALSALVDDVELLDSLSLPKPDSVPTGAHHPETSFLAAEQMKGIVHRLAGKVLREFLIAAEAGLTADAVQVRLRGTHQSVSPRVTELARKGWIYDTGQRRKTRSGRWANVYRPTIQAQLAAQHIEEWTW